MRGPERDAQDEAVTRGAKTVRILAVVAVLTVSAGFAAYERQNAAPALRLLQRGEPFDQLNIGAVQAELTRQGARFR